MNLHICLQTESIQLNALSLFSIYVFQVFLSRVRCSLSLSLLDRFLFVLRPTLKRKETSIDCHLVSGQMNIDLLSSRSKGHLSFWSIGFTDSGPFLSLCFLILNTLQIFVGIEFHFFVFKILACLSSKAASKSSVEEVTLELYTFFLLTGHLSVLKSILLYLIISRLFGKQINLCSLRLLSALSPNRRK